VLPGLSTEVSESPVTYLVVFGSTALDVLLPLIPSETIVIGAAVIAGQGGLLIFLIVPAAALGAFLGDNLAYLLGNTVGVPIARRLFRSEKAQARVDWAKGAIRRRGVAIIIVGRFIPGGRTATTFAAGTLGMAYRRFLPADAGAALVWALYLSMLGYLGGSTFEDNVLLPLLVALGFALLVTFSIEAWRRRQKQRGKDLLGDDLER
jgi:membrane protein DedA with SNARE-associated domain